MEKKLLELAVEIVQAQASVSKMSGDEIEIALVKVYNALHRMRLAEQEGQSVQLAGREAINSLHVAGALDLDPRSSIQEDKVTCMECMAEFRQLTANHLRTHQLSPREYKKKWGFPLKQPLAARVLTKLRSRSAKKRGLPEKLQLYLEQKRKDKGEQGHDIPGGGHASTKRTVRQPA